MGVIALAAVAGGVALAVRAASYGPGPVLAVLTGFVTSFGFALTATRAASRRERAGDPAAIFWLPLVLAPMFVGLGIGLFDRSTGLAILAGWCGGTFTAVLFGHRAARANHDIDATEAALAPDEDATHVVAEEDPLARDDDTPSAPVGQLLDEAVAEERRRWLAWLVAGAVITGACLTLDLPSKFMIVLGVAFFGVLPMIWVPRRLCGVWLARRAVAGAATPPRRAFVVLLDHSAALRPTLGIWSTPPVAGGGRIPPPEQVYLCCDQRDALLCTGATVVYEAWVGTGARRTSKPRWVAADAGIAVPHRRTLS